MSPSPAPAAPRPMPRRLRYLAAALAAIALVAAVQWWRRPPLLPVAMPRNPEALDPQVRTHVMAVAGMVRDDPRDGAKRATLGMAYAANGLWEEARQAFLDAAAVAPREPLARMYAAVALQERSDDAGALREFRAVAQEFPSFAPGWYRVGEAAMRTGDLALAEQAFGELARLAPGEWRGPAGLGEVRLRQGKPAEAAALLEKALGVDRGARPAQFLLGQAYRALGRTNAARIALALGAGESRRPMPDPWAEAAPAHMKSVADQLAQAEELGAGGRPDLAVTLLGEALKFHPGHAGLLNQLAVSLNRAGQPAQALGVLDPLVSREPAAVAPRITRAYARVLAGNAAGGLADAREAARIAPDSAQAHLAAANALLAMDRDAEVVAELRRAIECDPRNADIPVELADVLWRNVGDKAAAQALLEQAIALNPVSARAHARLGLVQKDRGDVAAARATLATLEAFAPGSPEARELRQALSTP